MAVERLVISFDGNRVSSTISGGISNFPDDGIHEEELIAAADWALYRAKEKGRNRIEMTSGRGNHQGI